MKWILCSAFLATLASCGGSGISLSTEFSGEYSQVDFNLSSSVSYWEIRIGDPAGSTEYTVRSTYDMPAYQGLDETQIQLLESAASMNGFSASCLPGYCPIYAVAIADYTTTIVDSQSDLMDFFGELDTEAELWIRLDYARDYEASTTPVSYEEVEGGYRALLDWDSLCQRRGQDLVMVYADGTIEKLREVSSSSYDSCA